MGEWLRSEAQEKPKKKGTRNPVRKFFTCLGVFLAVPILLSLICATTFVFALPYFTGQIQRTALSPSAIPTAETLLDVPHEIITEDFGLYLELIENYGAVWLSRSTETDLICVTATSVDDFGSNFRASSVLYINETLVVGANDFILEGDRSFDNSPYPRWCAYGELQAGLHLIEFHLRESLHGEPVLIHVQQWAIQIDN